MAYTHHAQLRAQQRADPADAGRSLAAIRSPRKVRRRHSQSVLRQGRTAQATGLRRSAGSSSSNIYVYVVVSSAQVVITVAHRDNRIRRH